MALEIEVGALAGDAFFPDEDYLAQAAMAEKYGWETCNDWDRAELLALTATFDPLAHQSLWTASLTQLGTCAFQGVIPPNAITRYAVIDVGAFGAGIGIGFFIGLQGIGTVPRHRAGRSTVLSLLGYIFDGTPLPGFPTPCPGVQVHTLPS